MKIHITNTYNSNKNTILSKRLQCFATAGHELGFLEMGIFCYPVESDSMGELRKRLDGIIASLEKEDVVFMQLPTGNGYLYENLLFNKIKAYRNTKIILILHDTDMLFDNIDITPKNDYISLCKRADAIIAPSCRMSGLFYHHDINNVLFYDKIALAEFIKESEFQLNATDSGTTISDGAISLYKTSFYTKKLLMDAIELIFANSNRALQSLLPLEQEEIQIAFGLHDKTGNYSVWVGTAILSVMEHTSSKICFHVMHDETLTESNRNRLIQTVANMNQRIVFHQIDVSYFSSVQNRVGGYSIATMFRVMLPDLLPNLEKIIYLDADILVARDIKELWDTDIRDYCIAAVPDMLTFSKGASAVPIYKNGVASERYFNAGILYLNLEKMRRRGNLLEETLNYLAQTPESTLPDQDALNVIYQDSLLLLDSSWNYWASFVRRNNEKKLSSKLYHYVGTRLHLFFFTEMDQLYYETLLRTPWGLEEARKQLNNTLGRITDIAIHRELLIKQLTNQKKFIFYGQEESSMRFFYELIQAREGDYRILKNYKQDQGRILPCQDFSLLSKEEKGTFIVFAAPGADNGTAFENLAKLGLEKNKDFFNILQLLPPGRGGYM